jgi:hypothetical protein
VGQVYQCWWRICREINVLSRFECHIFYVLYPFVTCLLTLPRARVCIIGNRFKLETAGSVYEFKTI